VNLCKQTSKPGGAVTGTETSFMGNKAQCNMQALMPDCVGIVLRDQHLHDQCADQADQHRSFLQATAGFAQLQRQKKEKPSNFIARSTKLERYLSMSRFTIEVTANWLHGEFV